MSKKDNIGFGITMDDIRKALDKVFHDTEASRIRGYYFCKGRNRTISFSEISTCKDPTCFHCSTINKSIREEIKDYPGIGGSPFKVEFNKDFIPSSDENNPQRV